MDDQAYRPMSAQAQSPLFNLPGEIRDMIFTTLIQNQRIPITKSQRRPQNSYGMLMSCKRSHAEMLKLFYSATTFVIGETWARRGVEWLAALPPEYRDWMTRVVFKRDLHSFGNMYSKLAYRASSEQHQQAMLLEPFLKELTDRGIKLREGVLRA